ncbi:unnamed protein product [Macrosiphum euphorbiae]|uniref:Uncharacterized protein n=1 Tax=Macrosiphum euphorbiae TaxID=13131 RepID=A0AAV0WC17_9HEMI|nr:unnamed protein product [Macrosiphum euphorbiae]
MLSNDNGGAENAKTTNTKDNSIAKFTAAEHITISAEASDIRKRTARKHDDRRTGMSQLLGTERRLSTTIDESSAVSVGSAGTLHTVATGGKRKRRCVNFIVVLSPRNKQVLCTAVRVLPATKKSNIIL